MDREKMMKLAKEYSIACSKTLFAIEQARRDVLNRKEKTINQASSKSISDQGNSQLQLRNSISSQYQEAKNQLELWANQEETVLRVAEYLMIGDVGFKEMPRDGFLPYLIPFLGHANICVSSSSQERFVFARDIIMQSLLQTAPGQLNITIYNPDLLDSFSCFAALEQYELVSTADALVGKLNDMAKAIIENDSLLKSKYNSLIELRKESRQAVGQLQLLVIADDGWINEEKIRIPLLRLATNGIRAGIAVMFVINEAQKKSISQLVKKTTMLYMDNNDRKWHCDIHPNFTLLPNHYTNSDIETQLASIKQASEKVSALTIPFDSIEPASSGWNCSSAEGITINLGKAGLTLASLTLGNDTTQLHNVLITGAPGKGKSNLLEVMIHSICCRYSPDEVELYLLDFKDGLTFKPYSTGNGASWLPHAHVLGLESARDFGVAVLRDLEEERSRRALIMSDDSSASVAIYRKKNPEKRLPRIIVLIDEYQKLVEVSDDLGNEAVKLIENIVKQGRACGIHLVLASQSVAHGGAIAGHEDDIYSTIPVRIALQNSLQESYSIFSQGNDAAARLRVRGEAVLNVNYGATDSNIKFTVAYADPAILQSLRAKWCKTPEGKNHIPITFRKNDQFVLSDAITSIQGWRRAVIENNAAPRLACGMMVSTKKKVLSVSMADDAGRNLAILGSGEGERTSLKSLPVNYAIGTLENMAISLALQHPEGNAFFTFINGLDKTTESNNSIPLWIQTMERFGFGVEIISAKDAAQYFVNLADEMKSISGCDEHHYVIAMGMDRCSGMAESVGDNMFDTSTGASAFQDILKNGPLKGIHILAWWQNVAIYREHIGFSGDGYIDTKMILRMDDATAKSIFGPFVSWSSMPNRTLIHDAIEINENITLLPIAPCDPHSIGKLEAVMWV